VKICFQGEWTSALNKPERVSREKRFSLIPPGSKIRMVFGEWPRVGRPTHSGGWGPPDQKGGRCAKPLAVPFSNFPWGFGNQNLLENFRGLALAFFAGVKVPPFFTTSLGLRIVPGPAQKRFSFVCSLNELASFHPVTWGRFPPCCGGDSPQFPTAPVWVFSQKPPWSRGALFGEPFGRKGLGSHYGTFLSPFHPLISRQDHRGPESPVIA